MTHKTETNGNGNGALNRALRTVGLAAIAGVLGAALVAFAAVIIAPVSAVVAVPPMLISGALIWGVHEELLKG